MYPSHSRKYGFRDVLARFSPYRFRLLSNTSVSGEFRYFGFCIPHHTAAEADHPAVHIHDRKDHPVPELIIYSLFFIRIDKPGLTDHILTVPLFPEVLIQIVTVNAGIPEARTP